MNTHPFDLSGSVAYLPGGYGDIGTALAWGLARAGARVAISGRDATKAEALATTLRLAGHEALGLAMDAHEVADIRRLMRSHGISAASICWSTASASSVSSCSPRSARRLSTRCCRST
jgi:NAD(P)-dependent dehydrogenase (short-subunit alcohol dehydrogenase family)